MRKRNLWLALVLSLYPWNSSKILVASNSHKNKIKIKINVWKGKEWPKIQNCVIQKRNFHKFFENQRLKAYKPRIISEGKCNNRIQTCGTWIWGSKNFIQKEKRTHNPETENTRQIWSFRTLCNTCHCREILGLCWSTISSI